MNVPRFSNFILLLTLSFLSCKNQNLDRVETAKNLKQKNIEEIFKQAEVDYSNFECFLSIFKKEELLELWVRDNSESDPIYQNIASYKFCTNSGKLGPKRKEGDRQIPEGIYHINRFNPKSKFYLSLGLNYPNASDLILSDKERPGSDIFIHGGCRSIGCVAITNEWISELYLIVSKAKSNGQNGIPVYIFPFRMNQNNLEENLKEAAIQSPFWTNLKTVFDALELGRKPIEFDIDQSGLYDLKK